MRGSKYAELFVEFHACLTVYIHPDKKGLRPDCCLDSVTQFPGNGPLIFCCGVLQRSIICARNPRPDVGFSLDFSFIRYAYFFHDAHYMLYLINLLAWLTYLCLTAD